MRREITAQGRSRAFINGALATAGYGTALGVIRGAIEAGRKVRVLADETRPFLQGARLTAWELVKDGIDTTVITDNMAGSIMRKGDIDLVVVGADRIARLVIGIREKFWTRDRTLRVCDVNGETGLCILDGERLTAAMSIATDGERILEVYAVINPDKLH